MNTTERITNKLNILLGKNYDAEAGYIAAKDNVKDTVLKNFFKERATNRYDFGHDIKEEIRSLGQKPDKGTSIKGDTHRIWMDLKSTFSKNSDEAVLEEAIRGEKRAILDYDDVITEPDVPNSTKTILEKHKNNIQNALESLKKLESIA